MAQRQYDIVLFGATGYTGKFAAEHITAHFPTDLSWAVAGRSQSKLSTARDALKSINADRKEPSIEVAALNSQDLNNLAQKTKILINCVGPYCLYGTVVVEACAKHGTHYLDVTGESPWIQEMIKKYHDTAKASGAIIIPEIGFESAPPDMITYALASHVRKTIAKPLLEAAVTIHAIKGGFSGGSFSTMLKIWEVYSPSEIASSGKRSAMCPIALPKYSPKPLLERVLGVRSISDLGSLAKSLTALSDVPLVYRSWGLLSTDKTKDEFYGENFKFNAYMTARNAFTGAMFNLVLTIMPLMLILKPFRWLMSKLVPEPGQGPSKEDSLGHHVEWKAVGFPDADTTQKAIASLRFSGNIYHLTGIFVAEGAATILYNEDISAKKLGGGVLTPATLGQQYIDRLSKVGVDIQTRMMAS